MENTTDGIYPSEHSGDTVFKAVSLACGCVMLIVFMCSLILTLSVLWAFWKTKQLQYSVYRIVAYLLLDEVLVRIFGSPLVITSTLAGRWLFGDFGCVFYAFWMTWLGVTATSLFACVAVERFLIICSKTISRRVSPRAADVMGLFCYLHGLIWAILPLAGVNHYVYEPSGVSCTPNWSRDNKNYIIGLFVACVVIPVLVSVVCYSAIFIMVKQNRQNATSIRHNANADSAVAVTLILTMVAFLFAWTPYSVIGLNKVFGYSEQILMSEELSLIPLVTAKTAGMWNPLIFSFKNREVRGFLTACLYRIRERLHTFYRRRNRVIPDPGGRNRVLPEPGALDPHRRNVINMRINTRNDRATANGSSSHTLELREPTVIAHLSVISNQDLNRFISANYSEIGTNVLNG